MDSFAKYLQNVSEGLKVLEGDINKIVSNKKKQEKDGQIKGAEDKDTSANVKKQNQQEQFKSLSLKSLQPVTKMYKNEAEIKQAKENPELDFITKQLETIFNK
jgi:hypothetical protein